MTDLELELRGLAAQIDFPPTPDLVGAVRARLEHRRRPFFARRRALAVALAAAALVVFAAMAVPSARTAILDWLGVSGVEIAIVDELPEVPASGALLAIGERTSVDAAERRAGYRVLRPRLTGLESPDAVYFSPTVGRPVTFLYGTTERARLLVTQFRGSPAIEKSVVIAKKEVPGGTSVEEVRVKGGRGLWISGAAHTFAFVDQYGSYYTGTLRLARNTLLWEQGALTVRLEGALTKAQALEIARSVR